MKAKPQEISEIGGPAQKESAFKVWKEKSGEWVGENPALTALILLMLVCSFFVMWAIITKTPLV